MQDDPHHNGAHREGFTPLKQKFWIRLYRRTITVPYLLDFTTFDVLEHPLRCASSFRGVYDGGGRVDPGKSEIRAGFRHPATPSTGWIPLRASRVEFPARLRRVRAPPATSTGVNLPSAAPGWLLVVAVLKILIRRADIFLALQDRFPARKPLSCGFLQDLPIPPTTERRAMAAALGRGLLNLPLSSSSTSLSGFPFPVSTQTAFHLLSRLFLVVDSRNDCQLFESPNFLLRGASSLEALAPDWEALSAAAGSPPVALLPTAAWAAGVLRLGGRSSYTFSLQDLFRRRIFARRAGIDQETSSTA
ncbi:hypothetical protein R3P38DRAFT_3223065 [Favolaschia claudopus]|uniref:Uncharacterized protein n=1 Tax=Favolaschia claudopus TaxID=2862362 RepID=A0AAV9ZY37_9AGAR